MAPSISIQSIRSDLESDKVKTREQGVADLRSFLSDPSHLRTCIENGEEDPKYWLGIYQALFNTVNEERKAVVKKGVDKSKSDERKGGDVELDTSFLRALLLSLPLLSI